MKELLPIVEASVIGNWSTLVMFILFVALVLVVYSRRRRELYHQIERLPLEDGDPR